MSDFDFGQILPRPTGLLYDEDFNYLVMHTCYDEYGSEWMSLVDGNKGNALPGYDANFKPLENDYWRCIVNVRIAYESGEKANTFANKAKSIWEAVTLWFLGDENTDGFKDTAEDWLSSVQNTWDSWFSNSSATGVRKVWNDFKTSANSWLEEAQAAWNGFFGSSAEDENGVRSIWSTWFENIKLAVAAAIAEAIDTAEHPNYIGEDYYVYRWNKATRTYDKTNVMLKGEGFHISKTFHSVDEMNAYVNLDPRPESDQLKENNFFLINTNDVEQTDNAKLYVVQEDEHGDLKPEFLVDMSGAIGFTGKTPQISFGTITTTEAGTDATATLTDDGTDDNGNPKYKLSLSIPRGDKGDKMNYSDLSVEEKKELADAIRAEMDFATVETCEDAADELT